MRFDRSFAHKYAKLASLPYEDEKFAYVILTKEKLTPPPCRVIAPPQKHSGHILLSLCMAEGLEKRTISRRQKEIYKQAKKVKWGDAFLISISRHTL